jgi:hypothetical protein
MSADVLSCQMNDSCQEVSDSWFRRICIGSGAVMAGCVSGLPCQPSLPGRGGGYLAPPHPSCCPGATCPRPPHSHATAAKPALTSTAIKVRVSPSNKGR